METICVTGHRKIPIEKYEYVEQELRRQIYQAIADGFTHFISGFAEGTDLIFAAIVAEIRKENRNIKLEAAIPYRNRMKTPNTTFQKLICHCDIIGVHSEDYSYDCFFLRNRFMVQQSQRVIAVYDGREKGGTVSTMRYAYSQGVEVRIIKV